MKWMKLNSVIPAISLGPLHTQLLVGAVRLQTFQFSVCLLLFMAEKFQFSVCLLFIYFGLCFLTNCFYFQESSTDFEKKLFDTRSETVELNK